MDKRLTDKSNNPTKKAEKAAKGWHFCPENGIRSDVSGSWTGNPASEEQTQDDEYLKPVQDVDDL